MNQFRKDQLALNAVEAELSKPAPSMSAQQKKEWVVAVLVGAPVAFLAVFGGVHYVLIAIAFATLFSLYMLPTLLLISAGRPWITMAFINLLCGWSIIGWFMCFVLIPWGRK